MALRQGAPNSRSIALLRQLIALPSITRQSNLTLIESVRDLLAGHGIECRIVPDESGTKANLFASVGPKGQSGVILSGHTDVVPVIGQQWSMPPFELTERAGKLFGRGSADMKGFIACAINVLIDAAERNGKQPLSRPLQLALSYDEEIGCIGVRSLLDVLAAAPERPYLCVIGEPTLMRVATGHKGKMTLHARCHGREGHSALAPLSVNAVHLGCDLVGAMRQTQAELAASGARDDAYDVPYSTLHVGKFNGGVALNIVPNLCELEFEIRNVAADDPQAILNKLRSASGQIVRTARALLPDADIDIDVVNSYPGLDTSPTEGAVAFFQSLVPATAPLKLAFGTEGGLFTHRLGVPVVVCGPGSIEQAHKPDEYVEVQQLDMCDVFLARLLASLA